MPFGEPNAPAGGPAGGPPIPVLFAGLIDDAAVFPPGSAALPQALSAHRQHRAAWYAELVGPLLVPASTLRDLATLLPDGERIDVGVIGDVPIDQLTTRCATADERIRIRQIEAPVAKRGEDPQPGLDRLLRVAGQWPDVNVSAEIPLTWGLLDGLDRLARARRDGTRIAAKFRTGGLAAELFPTPVELAAVICACAERDLPFKLTAGLHHAIRHTDLDTGFIHHGFLNVLLACTAAADGAEAADVANLLAETRMELLVDAARARRERRRPLWAGFGSCSISEPMEDLIRLGLLAPGPT